MKKIVFLLLLFSNHTFGSSQNIFGYVLNKNSRKSIPFVNVSLSENNMGTITNSEGYFSLSIPQEKLKGQLVFSFVGYKNHAINIKNSRSPYYVYLERDTIVLKEVFVSPDNLKYTLLKRAFENISNNYPDFSTTSYGFYREALKTKEDLYLYFGEALLEVYNTSYKNDVGGNVRMLKSRKNHFPSADTINSIKLYGGVFIPVKRDFVKNRISFINPKNFKNYSYKINGLTSYNDRMVYVISFHTKNDSLKGVYKGKFYIDKETLAYVYFDFGLTKHGCEERTTNKNLKCIDGKYQLLYELHGERFYLKAISDYENFINTKSDRVLFSNVDFVVTEVTDNSSPIPYKEQSKPTSIFSDDAMDYKESNWKDYNVLAKDSTLKNAIRMQTDTLSSKKILTTPYQNKKNFKDLYFNFARHLFFDINLAYKSCTQNLNQVHFTYIPSSDMLFENYIENISNEYYEFGYGIGYKFNGSFSIFFQESHSFSSNLSDNYIIGSGYQICVKNKGRKWFVIPSLGYYSSKNGIFISKFMNSYGSFNVGKKEVDADQFSLFIGNKEKAMVSAGTIKFRISHFTSLLISASYKFALSQTQSIFIKEEKNFLFNKKIYSEPISSSNTNLEFNNALIYNLNRLNFSIGLRLEL